ncbi:hypothetical protein [Geothrix sp.]|jgi:hypothetical protein|uniref:hypothetical protein n=1 Tax=Geothrix sp. TaxID=1962974 RepID=UPI0025C2F628|nr:hypothetical protein [Geothrix sp.]
MFTRPLLGRALRTITLRVTVGLRSCFGLKTADWILDLGPEGGGEGGRVIAVGTPEEVARKKTSVTGKYLAPYLK